MCFVRGLHHAVAQCYLSWDGVDLSIQFKFETCPGSLRNSGMAYSMAANFTYSNTNLSDMHKGNDFSGGDCFKRRFILVYIKKFHCEKVVNEEFN